MLLVDTCGSRGSVVLADVSAGASQSPAVRYLPGRETQERLLPAITEVLQELSLTPSDIGAFAVTSGPGSFTGVRIGLAAVKGLAEALQKPVVAISRLALLASRAQGNVEAWIDAGRGDVFRGCYCDGNLLDEAMLHGADAAAALPVGADALVMEEQLLRLHPRLRLVPEVSALDMLPLTVAAAAAGNFADTALLDANYLRVPDAELARRAAAALQAAEAARPA